MLETSVRDDETIESALRRFRRMCNQSGLMSALRRRAHYAPFFYAIALFALGYLGIGISLWPNIVPPGLSVHDAAAPLTSQRFVLVALVFSLPMVLIYTGYAYWVFRGKVRPGAGYAH